MAKKAEVTSKKQFTFSQVGSLLDSISKKVPIVIDDGKQEKEYISTGNYLLDAAISTRMSKGGILGNRTTLIYGVSGAGKSFLAYSICKNAQRDKNMCVIYIDTEFSIDLNDLPNYGIDIAEDRFKLIRAGRVEDITIMMNQIIDDLKEQKLAGAELPKMMFVIDSISASSSKKQKDDLIKGELKTDMTKAKAITALMSTVNTDLGMLNIPFLVIGQSYDSQDNPYADPIIRGGRSLYYVPSNILLVSKSKLKTGQEDELDMNQTGINVTIKCVKNRMAKPKKIQIQISFSSGLNKYIGLQYFCREEFFDKVGIAKGKMEVDKKTGEMKMKFGQGQFWYIRHLDKHVRESQLFNSEVFSDKVIEALDDVLYDYFRYKSFTEIEEMEKDLERLEKESADNDYDSDEVGEEFFK